MIRIRLLGQLAVEIDGSQLEPPGSRPARELLAWLALHPGLHPRGELAARFWPDVLSASARASLRSALWALRRSLADAAPQLVATRDVVGLQTAGGLWLDTRAFRELVAEERVEDALSLVRGELLADLDADWVLEARPRWQQEVADAFARAATRAEAAGDGAAALGWSRRAVELQPLSEEAWRALIRRLIAGGDAAGALDAYRRLRERLRRELGIVPSPQTRALAEGLRAQRRGGQSAQPAPQDDDARPSHEPPLVGRDRELEELAAFLQAAQSGSGSAVALTGEPGIGKTRLVTALAQLARERHGLVVTAAAPRSPAPLGLWGDVVDELAEELGPLPDGGWVRELAAISPRLAARVEAPRHAVGELPPDVRRARLFEAVAQLLAWVSRDQWLLIALEDLHAADAASLELLAYAGRRLPRLRALAVLTRRDSPTSPGVDVLLDGLRSRGTLCAELTLTRLSDADVRRLAHLAAPLTDVEQVVEVAGGSPLLAVESARALVRGEGAISGSVRSLVRAWLHGLAPQTRALAELAAAAGRPLTPGELDALGLEPAAESVDAGLLVAGAGRVGYRHTLLADAVYEDLAEPRRSAVHEALADALGALGGRRASEVAEHLRRAGHAERASAALRDAARQARAVGSLDESARLLGAALETRPADGELWLELAQVEAWRDRREAVEAAFARALESIGPDQPLARVDAWVRRADWYKSALCAPQLALESAARALELLEVTGVRAADAEARAFAAAAWAQAVAGDADEAEAFLARLEATAGANPASDLLRCEIGSARGSALLRRGRFDDARAPFEEAARAAMSAGRPDLAGACWDGAMCAASLGGEPAQALALNSRALVALRGHGLIAFEARTLVSRSQLLLELGRESQARAEAERAIELGEALDRQDVIAEAQHQRALVAVAAGDHDDAQRLLAAALAADPPLSRPLARLVRAEALLQLGRTDEAAAELSAAALEPVSAGDAPDALVPRLVRLQGLIAAARGDRELAARRLDEAAQGWRWRIDRESVGDRFAAVLADLGRSPVVGVVKPERELRRVLAEREALAADAGAFPQTSRATRG